ncbi:MAG TPA: amidohydrolase family protein [Micromonosporaceae bacterium]|nr:amidohydrolase family protein [Micromonosporaceae bacterium]
MTPPARNSARTLYRGGRVYSPAGPGTTAVLVEGDRIGWVGVDADAPRADTVVDLAGALLAPAFVDAHVHATDTGVTLLGLDLAGTRSAAEVTARVAAHAATLPGDAVVVGHGWDESGWPEQAPPDAVTLDRAGGGRRVYLAQASVHSAVVSSALLAVAPRDVPGYHAGGWLRLAAHHAVRAVALGSISPAQRRAAQRATLERAASLGIAAVHECGGPGTSSEDDFTGLLALSRAGGVPAVYGYWGELGGAAKARDLGAVGAGGDLYADGAIGAHTACLREPYHDRNPGHADARGHRYLTAAQVSGHLVDCARHTMQGGFHAIGDAAIATVLDGLALADTALGGGRVRAGRHRVEHVEILDEALIAGLADFGVVASMQPAFDRLWGGTHGMYAQRLGVARSLASNPVGALAAAGVALAFGSDSPVTPLDPWGTVLAATRHHNPAQRIDLPAAFAAHTVGGWRAAGVDDEGLLLPGSPATFAVWHWPGTFRGGLPAPPEPAAAGPTGPDPYGAPICRRTVRRGEVIYASG